MAAKRKPAISFGPYGDDIVRGISKLINGTPKVQPKKVYTGINAKRNMLRDAVPPQPPKRVAPAPKAKATPPEPPKRPKAAPAAKRYPPEPPKLIGPKRPMGKKK